MKILLSGPFDREAVAQLAETMRSIERRQTDQVFQMLIAETGLGQEEAEAMLKRVFPFVDDAPVEVKVWRRDGQEVTKGADPC